MGVSPDESFFCLTKIKIFIIIYVNIDVKMIGFKIIDFVFSFSVAVKAGMKILQHRLAETGINLIAKFVVGQSKAISMILAKTWLQ
jgi:hypothetical protein